MLKYFYVNLIEFIKIYVQVKYHINVYCSYIVICKMKRIMDI